MDRAAKPAAESGIFSPVAAYLSLISAINTNDTAAVQKVMLFPKDLPAGMSSADEIRTFVRELEEDVLEEHDA